MKKTEPLLKTPDAIDRNHFPDMFWVTAQLIEESLIQAGATPGKDYTVVDLYSLAQPFVLSKYEKGTLTGLR